VEILLNRNKQKIAGSIADQLLGTAAPTGIRTTLASKSAISIGQSIVLRPTGLSAPTDTTPPTKPTNLQATGVSTSQINLSWAASTDNVGVVGYEVYRNGVFLTSVGGTSYSDIGLAPSTTYSYQVAAVDAAPNHSALSDPASATTLAAATGISFRAASSASSKSTSALTINRPSGSQTGDVLIASLDVRSALTSSQVTASGWQLVRVDTAGTGLTKLTYWRALVANQAASYVFSFPTAVSVSGAIVAYSGVDTVNPIEARDGLGSATSSRQVVAPSITTVSPNTMVVGLYSVATSATFAPPSGTTERVDIALGAGSFKVTGEVADIPRAAGTWGPLTAVASAAGAHIGQTIALRPAS
jgi:chitodextrinase